MLIFLPLLLLFLSGWAPVECGIEFEETAWTRATWDEFKLYKPRSTWRIADNVVTGQHSQALTNMGYEFLSTVGPIYRVPKGTLGEKNSRITDWIDGKLEKNHAKEAFFSPICHVLMEVMWSSVVEAVVNEMEVTKPKVASWLPEACDLVQDSVVLRYELKGTDLGDKTPLEFALVSREGSTKATSEERHTIFEACLHLVKLRKEEITQALMGSAIQYQLTIMYFHSDNEDTLRSMTFDQDCEDHHSKCEMWADSGECQANPRYMLHYCMMSCGVCRGANGYERLGKYWLLPKQIKELTESATEKQKAVLANGCPSINHHSLTHLQQGQVQVVRQSSQPSIEDGTEAQKQLSEVLHGRCAYFNQGWWTYEICFSSQIRKVHFDSRGIIMMQSSLGMIKTASYGHQFTSSEANELGIADNSQSYILEEFTNGEECKIGDEEMLRKSTLQITCGLDHQTGSGHHEAHIVLYEPNQCEHIFTLFLAEMCEIIPLLDVSRDEL